MYNVEIYTPGTEDYSWIDTLRLMKNQEYTMYVLRNDTLFQTWVQDPAGPLFLARLMKYNMARTDFLTLRQNSAELVKADLLAIPSMVKAGIFSVRNETGDQALDIIKISDIADMDSGLVDVPQDMIDEGVSPALANKFRSPETVADFVTELLSGPYSFDETIDSQHIAITVNITAMLDNPVQDLKTMLPKYEWLPDSEWLNWEFQQQDAWEGGPDAIWMEANDVHDIPPEAVAGYEEDPMDPTSGTLFLTNPPAYTVKSDSSANMMPVKLLDDSGNPIEFDAIDSLIDAKTFFPYFDDYTFKGLFPGMTRAKWLELVYGKN
jgi:hypothetical protein